MVTARPIIIAGAGLTRSGRTFAVGANADASIVVNADDVQIGVLATDAQHGLRGGGTQHADASGAVAGFLSGTTQSVAGAKTFTGSVFVGSVPTNAGGATLVVCSAAPYAHLENSTGTVATGYISYGYANNPFQWTLGANPGTSACDAKRWEVTDVSTVHYSIRNQVGTARSRHFWGGFGATVIGDANFNFKHNITPVALSVGSDVPTLIIRGDTAATDHNGDIQQWQDSTGIILAKVSLAGKGTFIGVAVGGALTGATTGAFSGAVSAASIALSGALSGGTTGNFSGALTAGSLVLSGSITGATSGAFSAGLTCTTLGMGGALTGATSGAFSSGVTCTTLGMGGALTGATTGAFSGLVTNTVASGSPAYNLLQGAQIAFDGATGAKTLSSDGTTLSVTGLTFTVGGNLVNSNSFSANSANAVGLRGKVANGATAVAVNIYNSNALSTAGAQIAAFWSDNLSTKVAHIGLDGKLTIVSVAAASDAITIPDQSKINFGTATGNIYRAAGAGLKSDATFQTTGMIATTYTGTGATLTTFTGNGADGASGVNTSFRTSTTFSNATSKLFQFCNLTTEKRAIDLNGKMVVPTGGAADTAGISGAMVAGTITINTTAVTAASVISLTAKTAGGVQGILSYTVVAGTSFTINSTSAADTSTVAWEIGAN